MGRGDDRWQLCRTGHHHHFTETNGVTSTEMRAWGLGIVQNFSAAATDLYISAIGTLLLVSSAWRMWVATSVQVPHRQSEPQSQRKTLQTEGIDEIVTAARVLC